MTSIDLPDRQVVFTTPTRVAPAPMFTVVSIRSDSFDPT